MAVCICECESKKKEVGVDTPREREVTKTWTSDPFNDRFVDLPEA